MDGKHIYHVGIIDYLQDYSLTKKLENFTKRQFYGNMISAVPPKDYALRFLRFMKSNVIINQARPALQDKKE